MRALLVSSILTVILLWDVNSAWARNCDGERIVAQDIDTTITFRQTVRINKICTRKSTPGRDVQFLGVEILEYPQGVIKLVSNDYSLAFSANRVGEYQIKYRLRVSVRGRVGYFNRVMNLKVVEGSL